MATDEEWAAWETAAIVRLGKSVARWRKIRGLSQAELADDIGISKGAIANIESKTPRLQALPSLGTFIRIAAGLTVSPIDLIYPATEAEYDVVPGIHWPNIRVHQWWSDSSHEYTLLGLYQSAMSSFEQLLQTLSDPDIEEDVALEESRRYRLKSIAEELIRMRTGLEKNGIAIPVHNDPETDSRLWNVIRSVVSKDDA